MRQQLKIYKTEIYKDRNAFGRLLLDATLMRSETKRKEKNDSGKTNNGSLLISDTVGNDWIKKFIISILKKKPLNFLESIEEKLKRKVMHEKIQSNN
jgi:hypothetical protein